MAKATKINFCSFCGKPQGEVKKMIAGPAGVFICDSCVRVCKTIIDRELGEKKTPVKEPSGKAVFNLQKPSAIKAFLDQHVIGQDHAKKVLSVAVHNHYKRLAAELGINSKQAAKGQFHSDELDDVGTSAPDITAAIQQSFACVRILQLNETIFRGIMRFI